MRPSRRALAAAPLALLLLAACGSGEVTQESVADAVADGLTSAARAGGPLEETEAEAVGQCVGRRMFESGDFSSDEREAARRASDSGDADPDLVAKVEALVTACLEEDREGPGSG